MRIYIAGPYSNPHPHKVQENVDRAIAAGMAVVKKGHWPYIPHLSHYTRDPVTGVLLLTYEQYLTWDIAWLQQCEGLLFLGSSPGTDKELALAEELNLTIFYSVDEVPDTPHGYTDFEDHSSYMFPDRG